VLASCGGGSGPEESPDPGFRYQVPATLADGWRVSHAADQGIDPVDLEALADAVLADEFPHVDSIAVARSGELVFDHVFRTRLDDRDDRVGNTDLAMHAQFSATKGVTSLLVGIAVDQGIFTGPDQAYLDLFDYPELDNPDPRKSLITLGDVLAMRLGLEWDEWDPPYTSTENRLNRFYEQEVDYSKALLDLPMVADPGSAFAYNTAATISLGQAIENRAPMALVDYGASELMAPLEISDIEFLETPTGLPNGGSGFYFRTRDMVKFGQLLLDGGSWKGNRVVSEAWIAELLVPRTDIQWLEPDAWDWQLAGYGYQWWLGYYEVEGETVDTWVAWGFGGQWVVVVPTLDLVVAVNTGGYDGSDAALNEGHALIRRFIVAPLMEL
jgi:CubicO group peptidase (beta-lactamase class C family)